MTPSPPADVPAENLLAPHAAVPRWERWVLWVMLALFVAAGINHVSTRTYEGQDFGVHAYATEELFNQPSRWFPQDFTNRPMLYWVGQAGHLLTHGQATFGTAAFLCVLEATLALWLLHDSTRFFIRSSWLRLCAVGFVAFLPPNQVSVVVFAGDAVGPLPFAFTIWALLRSFGSVSLRATAGYAALAALGLVVGNFSRMPFLVLPAAILATLLLIWRWGRLSGRRAFMIAAVALIAPTIVGVWLHRRAVREFAYMTPHHQMNWHGTGEMTWRYLLWFKASDKRIFDAPSYWDTFVVNGQVEFGLPYCQNFTYPALFHLGLYTDILNYADAGETNNSVLRPEPQLTYSRWAVRLGVLTSVAMIIALLSLVIRSVAAFFTRNNPPPTGALLWGLMALAWYLPLVLVLPYVKDAYLCGYWLPRIVLPALWGFGVVLFAAVDQWLAGRARWLPIIVAIVIFAQAALHLRSVWF